MGHAETGTSEPESIDARGHSSGTRTVNEGVIGLIVGWVLGAALVGVLAETWNRKGTV
jgi:hypothetical protein